MRYKSGEMTIYQTEKMFTMSSICTPVDLISPGYGVNFVPVVTSWLHPFTFC